MRSPSGSSALVGVSDDLILFVPDRPGHELAVTASTAHRLRALSWDPAIGFDDGLAAAVEWYRTHREWLYAAHAGDVVAAARPPQR